MSDVIKAEDIPPHMAWNRGKAHEIATILNAALEAGLVVHPDRELRIVRRILGRLASFRRTMWFSYLCRLKETDNEQTHREYAIFHATAVRAYVLASRKYKLARTARHMRHLFVQVCREIESEISDVD